MCVYLNLWSSLFVNELVLGLSVYKGLRNKTRPHKNHVKTFLFWYSWCNGSGKNASQCTSFVGKLPACTEFELKKINILP